VSTAFTVDSPG